MTNSKQKKMQGPLAIIGAPSSAGAYSPGQEKTPDALRDIGLMEIFASQNIPAIDYGNVPEFRWVADLENPRAMNLQGVIATAKSTARLVSKALTTEARVLVLGGDCTVEIGTVAAAVKDGKSVGLIYIDLDTDLNTPQSTNDGALDWMGVSHMLGIEGTEQELVEIGPSAPLLGPEQVLFFSHHNVKPFEREIITKFSIEEMPFANVFEDPAGCAQKVVDNWARKFDRLLIHLDVDVLDFARFPLAENTRRNNGLRLDQLMAALRVFLLSPNFTSLTITEINPDHGELDGSTLRFFAEELARAFTPLWEMGIQKAIGKI